MGREALVDYDHDSTKAGAERDGACMWVAPRLQHLILNSRHTRYEWIVWVQLRALLCVDLILLTLHAATVPVDWEEQAPYLPRKCRWILCGY